MASKKIVLNFFQTIAVTGVCTSVVAQIGLLIADKHVENFWAVYPCWLFLFLLGTGVKYFHLDQHEH